MREHDKFWLFLAVGLFIVFNYVVSSIESLILSSFLLVFFIVRGLYVYVLMDWGFGIKPFRNLSKFAAIFMLTMAFDIMLPPFLVTMTGLASTDPFAVLSSDVAIYQLFNLSGTIGYNIVFVAMPVILIFLATRIDRGMKKDPITAIKQGL
jgi:hypothetical protein